jgi:hypothetical protein
MIKTAILTNQNKKSLPYPKLMITESALIVLFNCHAVGIVLSKGTSTYALGYYSNSWEMNAFTDFYEAITLQNELP